MSKHVGLSSAEAARAPAEFGPNVVANLTVVNFAIVVGLVAYAHVIGMSAAQITPLVLVLLSAVPVALAVTFTLAAAIGARTLAFKSVLPTRLSALHEAATIDGLRAGKTGTLTKNELGVAAISPARLDSSEADVLA